MIEIKSIMRQQCLKIMINMFLLSSEEEEKTKTKTTGAWDRQPKIGKMKSKLSTCIQMLFSIDHIICSRWIFGCFFCVSKLSGFGNELSGSQYVTKWTLLQKGSHKCA